MPLCRKGFSPTSICCSNRLAAKQNMAMSLAWLSGSDVAKYSRPWDFQIILSWEFPARSTVLHPPLQVYFGSLISVKIQTVTDMVNRLHCCPCPEPTFFFVFETWRLGWSFMVGRLLPLYSQSHGAPGGHIQNNSGKKCSWCRRRRKKQHTWAFCQELFAIPHFCMPDENHTLLQGKIGLHASKPLVSQQKEMLGHLQKTFSRVEESWFS